MARKKIEETTNEVVTKAIETPSAETSTQKQGFDPYRVITIDGSFRTDAKKKVDITSQLMRDRKNNKVLKGTIGSIEYTRSNNPYAVVYLENYKVIIPAFEIVNEKDWPDTDDGNLELRKHLNSMMGAEIDFIIKEIDEMERLITGSRKEAMAAVRRKFFSSDHASGRALVVEGSLVEARIIAVSFTRVYLEIFGVDVLMPVSELAWNWINDMREVFYVGGTAVVKIIKIEGSGEDISITASVKQAQDDPYAGASERFKIRSTYIGDIAAVNDKGIIVTLAAGIDCLCPHPDWMNTHLGAGTKVSVMIVSINEQKHHIRGRLLRLISLI